uniref:Uncharacterized protein n=1 Tax=Solanum tuberosum TaxID=4113 RepID=M1DQG3_SOLTU
MQYRLPQGYPFTNFNDLNSFTRMEALGNGWMTRTEFHAFNGNTCTLKEVPVGQHHAWMIARSVGGLTKRGGATEGERCSLCEPKTIGESPSGLGDSTQTAQSSSSSQANTRNRIHRRVFWVIRRAIRRTYSLVRIILYGINDAIQISSRLSIHDIQRFDVVFTRMEALGTNGWMMRREFHALHGNICTLKDLPVWQHHAWLIAWSVGGLTKQGGAIEDVLHSAS